MNLSAILGNDSAFGRLMTKCGTIIAVNILFAITCIPFFTIGAAGTAMYHVIFDVLHTNSDKTRKPLVNPFRSYWQGLRRNFLRATLCWLAFTAVMALGFINVQICRQLGGAAMVLSAGVIAVMTVASVTMIYLMPVMAEFEGKTADLIKLSMITAVSNPLKMIIVVFLTVCPLVLMYADEAGKPAYAFAGTFFLFGAIAYYIGKLLLPVFEKYKH